MDRLPDTDSLCSLLESFSLTETERARFQAQLTDFPHTFQLQGQERLGRVKLTQLKKGLESALSVGHETSLETARARNLMAYCLCRLHQPEYALQQIELVLEMEEQRKNLVTLANKVVILWTEMRLSEADQLLQSLVEMKTRDQDFQYLVVRAKAELAFTCTRLGPSFFPYAVAMFEEVIPRAREPEIWLWKFGLALTKRRCIREKPQDITLTPSVESAAEQRDLLILLLEIKSNCVSTSLKAKVYSELALLLHMVSKTTLNKEFRSMADMDPEQACEKALKLDPDDNSVLCKCGKIFRYIRQTERSRDLLEKAVSIRPSSTGYHHLGITYKALACSEKYKNEKKVPGYYKQLERLQAGPRRAEHYNSRQQRPASSGRPQFSRNGNIAVVAGNTSDVPSLSLNRDVRLMQRVIKSPPKGVTQYRRSDKFIKEALDNFQKAIDFSQGENMRATYDMALLLKTLGEPDAAYQKLKDMLKNEYNLFVSDKINVYEQMGLVLKELAESETNEEKKKHMMRDSSKLLYQALVEASKIFSGSPGIKEHLGELYRSFPVLIQEIEFSDNDHRMKLQMKARLFQLIKNHKQSLELLQEIEKMDPDKCKDPSYLQQYIEDYIALEEFEKALTFVTLLTGLPQSPGIMELFGDKNYVVKIRMWAGRQALLQGNQTIARLHFRPAFLEATSAHRLEESSSEYDTDSSEDAGSNSEVWDVAILHEETRISSIKAIVFSTLLENNFGLKVSVTGKDAPPNRFDQEGELHILKKSTMVIVLAGGKICRELRVYIHHIAKWTSTVTLLVDGDRVPGLLKANRSLLCPLELLHMCRTAESEKLADSEKGASYQPQTADSEKGASYQPQTADSEKGASYQPQTADGRNLTEAEVDAICQLFSFLVNIGMQLPEAAQVHRL